MHNWFAGSCHEKKGYKPCFSEGCFLETKMCDGYNDCADWSDESDCKFILRHFDNSFLMLMAVNQLKLLQELNLQKVIPRAVSSYSSDQKYLLYILTLQLKQPESTGKYIYRKKCWSPKEKWSHSIKYFKSIYDF